MLTKVFNIFIFIVICYNNNLYFFLKICYIYTCEEKSLYPRNIKQNINQKFETCLID